jgi:hypothetical protein
MLDANTTMRCPDNRPPGRSPSRAAAYPAARWCGRSSCRRTDSPPWPTGRRFPVTTAKLFGACPIPTSELTFNAKVTSRGARNSRLVLMNAKVYSEMNPHPIRLASADSCSSPASATVRYSNPSSQPGGGGQIRVGAGSAPPGTGNVGHRGTTPSSSSVVSCGVKMLELDAGVLGREPPVDTATGTVACRLPR